MKKIALLLAIAAAFGVFAAFDFSGARSVSVLDTSTTVNAGTTNVTEITAAGLRGNAALFVTANGNPSRTELKLSLWTTNTVEGGWTALALQSYTATNAGVFRLSFPAEYISQPSQVRIESNGAATAATAFILSY